MHKENIINRMKEVFKEIPYGIEHTLRVLKNAEDIMEGKEVSDKQIELITAAAILHDIGQWKHSASMAQLKVFI